MGTTWKTGLTLDRKETDKDYSPDNCKWSTPKEQQNNRRCCVRLTIGGETKTVTQWCEHHKIDIGTFNARRRKGWDAEKALTTPVAFQSDSPPVGNLTFNGKTQNVAAWSKEVGIKSNAIYARLKLGWTVERALTTPVQKHNNQSRI